MIHKFLRRAGLVALATAAATLSSTPANAVPDAYA